MISELSETPPGKAYPIIGGAIEGGYHFTGSGYSVTGGAGGELSNCYATVNNQLYPAACYSAGEQDTEYFYSGSQTLYVRPRTPILMLRTH